MLSVYALTIMCQIDRNDEPFQKYLKQKNFIIKLMDPKALPYFLDVIPLAFWKEYPLDVFKLLSNEKCIENVQFLERATINLLNLNYTSLAMAMVEAY
jgi:hypothetical protein